jgi:hypothetical protein
VDAPMRKRESGHWITACCGFAVLALILFAEIFLLNESVALRSANLRIMPSDTAIRALFHGSR